MKFKSGKDKNNERWFRFLREAAPDPFTIKEGKFRHGQLKDSAYYSDWTEESFLPQSRPKEMVTRSFDFSRLRFFAFLFLLGLSALLARSAWVQVIQRDHYYLLSEGNRLRAETVEPKRGIIYARDLRPLVRNKANFVLYFRPIDLPRDELARDELLREIAGVLADASARFEPTLATSSAAGLNLIPDSDIFYQLKDRVASVKIGSLESYQPLFIADNIEYDKAMLINLRLADWPGVFISNKIRREYLDPSLGTVAPLGESSLAHILGYTGKISQTELERFGSAYSLIDYVGKAGLEYSWEAELKGESGRKNIEVDALGRQKKIINEVPARDGYSLLLALDLDLQKKAEEVTRAYLSRAGLKRASVVILNPNNGEVMALVSLPGYDNNLFAPGISQADYAKFLEDPDLPLFNRAISGEFPSGSTIKPIFAVGALEEGIIDERTSFLSTGGLRIGEWFFPDWKAGGHGQTDVRSALAFSVNTFFYYIGGGYGDFKGMGLSGLVKYSRLFGLGEKTGLDLNGEAEGFVPTQAWKEETKNEPWYIGDTYHFAIGQGDVLATPLQVANYTAAIANGGTLYQPHLVTALLSGDEAVVKKIEPRVIADNLASPDSLRIVREGLRQTVTIGSARYLDSLPVAAAGKTGTAQWSSQKANHAWFTGFAPYDNPALVITILVEEGVEGSTIAVPIAHDILNWYFSPRP